MVRCAGEVTQRRAAVETKLTEDVHRTAETEGAVGTRGRGACQQAVIAADDGATGVGVKVKGVRFTAGAVDGLTAEEDAGAGGGTFHEDTHVACFGGIEVETGAAAADAVNIVGSDSQGLGGVVRVVGRPEERAPVADEGEIQRIGDAGLQRNDSIGVAAQRVLNKGLIEGRIRHAEETHLRAGAEEFHLTGAEVDVGRVGEEDAAGRVDPDRAAAQHGVQIHRGGIFAVHVTEAEEAGVDDDAEARIGLRLVEPAKAACVAVEPKGFSSGLDDGLAGAAIGKRSIEQHRRSAHMQHRSADEIGSAVDFEHKRVATGDRERRAADGEITESQVFVCAAIGGVAIHDNVGGTVDREAVPDRVVADPISLTGGVVRPVNREVQGAAKQGHRSRTDPALGDEAVDRTAEGIRRAGGEPAEKKRSLDDLETAAVVVDPAKAENVEVDLTAAGFHEGRTTGEFAEDGGVHVRADEVVGGGAFHGGGAEVDAAVDLVGVAVARSDVESLPLLPGRPAKADATTQLRQDRRSGPRGAIGEQLGIRIAFADGKADVEDGSGDVRAQVEAAAESVHDDPAACSRRAGGIGRGTAEIGLNGVGTQEDTSLIDDPVAGEAILAGVNEEAAEAVLHEVTGVGDLPSGVGGICSGGTQGANDQIIVVPDIGDLRCRAKGNPGVDDAGSVDDEAAAADLDTIGGNGCDAGAEADVARVEPERIGIKRESQARGIEVHGTIDIGPLGRHENLTGRRDVTRAHPGEPGVHESVIRRVGEELEVRRVDHPRRDHAVGDTPEGGETVGTGATEELDALIAAELPPVDRVDLKGAVVAGNGEPVVETVRRPSQIHTGSAANDEGGGAVEQVALNNQLAELRDRHVAYRFGDFDGPVPHETESAVGERERGVIVPSTLSALAFETVRGEQAGGVVEAQFRSAPQGHGGEIVGSRRVQEGAAETAGGENAPGVEGAGGKAAAEVEGAAAIHDRAAGVVVGCHQGDGTAPVASVDIVHVKAAEGQADDQIRSRARENIAVGHVAAHVEGAPAGTEAIGVACARPERGGVVAAIESDSVGGGTEEAGAVADLRHVERLGVDGVQGDDAAPARLAGAVEAVSTRKVEVGCRLRSPGAADEEVEVGKRCIGGQAEDAVVVGIAAQVKRACPSGNEVSGGVELDRGARVYEDIAGAEVGFVADRVLVQREHVAFEIAEEERAAIDHSAAFEVRGVVRVDEKRSSILLVEGAFPGNGATDRGARVEGEVGVLRHRDRLEGDGVPVPRVHCQEGSPELSAEGQIAEAYRLGRSAIEAIDADDAVRADDEVRGTGHRGGADREVVADEGVEHLHRRRVVAVVADVETTAVESDGRVLPERVGGSIGESGLDPAEGDVPAADFIGTGTGVAVGEEDGGGTGLLQGRRGGGDPTIEDRRAGIADRVEGHAAVRISGEVESAVDQVVVHATGKGKRWGIQRDIVDLGPGDRGHRDRKY